MGVPAARHGVTPYVDGLRGVAVLGIFLLHCWNYAGSPPIPFFGGNAGWVPFSLDWGVDLFFILSGFLLAQPWFRAEFGVGPQPSLSNYWRRRLRRILPAYYVSVIVTLAIFSYFGPIRQGSIEGSTGLWNLGGLALLMHGYIPVSASMLSGANGPWWTLTVEFTWYALLPLCVWAFTRRRWVVALPAAAAI